MADINNTNLQFRIATPEDAPQLQKLVQAAFRAEDSRENWTADMTLNSSFRMEVEEVLRIITKPDSAILIATNSDDDNNTLVACCGISKRSDNLARFGPFAVDTQLQRRGLGRQVLAYAEDYCRRTWGVKKLELNALSTRRELIAWYMRCGYQKTGASEPFPHDRFEELDLPEDMCFIMFEKDLNTAPLAAGTG